MKPRLIFFVLLLLSVVVAACGDATTSPEAQVNLKMAPESELPEFVREAAPQVKEAYRFAVANPEVLSAFPCYCGCSAIGHQNNLQCYIKEVRADGSFEFENHAFG